VGFESGGEVAPASVSIPANEGANWVASRNSLIYHLSTECRAAAAIKPADRISGPAAKQGRTLHEGCPVH